MIQKAFLPLTDTRTSTNGPNDLLLNISDIMAAMLSRVNKGYWVFEPDLISKSHPYAEFRTCFKVRYIKPEALMLRQNGNSRLVYRVGFTHMGQKVSWAQLSPKELNMESAFADLKMDIYIQSHALNRLKERLDAFPDQLIHHLLYLNTNNGTIATNNKGQSLIAFSTGAHKMGYLLFEYIQGALVIKTFLFLTHNNTPEGEKLQQLLQLEKYDRQYLALDKLSHFIHSDIPSNKKLFAIFEDAGCADLFQVNDKLIKQGVEEKKHAALIEQYIHYNAENERMNYRQPQPKH